MEIKQYEPLISLDQIPTEFFIEVPEGKEITIESPQVHSPGFFQQLAQLSERYRIELGINYRREQTAIIARGDFDNIGPEQSKDGHTHTGTLKFQRHTLPSFQDLFNAKSPFARIITSASVVETTRSMSQENRETLNRKSKKYPNLNLYDTLRYIYPYSSEAVAVLLRRYGIDIKRAYTFEPSLFRNYSSQFVTRLLMETGFISREPSLLGDEEEVEANRLAERFRLLYAPEATMDRIRIENQTLDGQISQGENCQLVTTILERSPDLSRREVLQMIQAYKEGLNNPQGQTEWFQIFLREGKVPTALEYKLLFVKGFATRSGFKLRGEEFKWNKKDCTVFKDAREKLSVAVGGRGDLEAVADIQNREDPYHVWNYQIASIMPSREITYFLSRATDLF